MVNHQAAFNLISRVDNQIFSNFRDTKILLLFFFIIKLYRNRHRFLNTLYYPIGDLYECYLPRNITQGCVLSIIDNKMCGIEQNILEVKKHYVFFKLNVLK